MEKVINLKPKTLMEHGLQAAASLRDLGFEEAAKQVLLMNTQGALERIDVAFDKTSWEHSSESTVQFYKQLGTINADEPGAAAKLAETLGASETDVKLFLRPPCMPLSDKHRDNIREELQALLPITYRQVVTETLRFDGLRSNQALAIFRTSLYKTVFAKLPPDNPLQADVELESFHTKALDLNMFAIVLAAAETVRGLERDGKLYAELAAAPMLTIQKVVLLFENFSPVTAVEKRLQKKHVPDTITALEFFTINKIATEFGEIDDERMPLRHFLNLDANPWELQDDGTLIVRHAEYYTPEENIPDRESSGAPARLTSGQDAFFASAGELPAAVEATAGDMKGSPGSGDESEEEAQ